MDLGDAFEIGGRTFKVVRIYEQPNTGLVEIAEYRDADVFKFTIPVAILDELVSMTTCPICDEKDSGGLEACSDCYNRALAKKGQTAGIDELAKRNAELQYELEQITARRGDALQIIEAQRETIRGLKEQIEQAETDIVELSEERDTSDRALAKMSNRYYRLGELAQKVEEDVNWMMNNEKLLSPETFKYLHDAVEEFDAE